jgi:hypothetical protein
MRNVSDRICKENQNTFYVLQFFLRKSRQLWDNVEKYGAVRQATEDNIAHALSMPDI